MTEQTFARPDDDEEPADFEDVIDSFVLNRLNAMSEIGASYPTRDGFVAQVMLLIEIALINCEATHEAVQESATMTASFKEVGVTIKDKPSAEWARKVVESAIDYITHRREVEHLEHKASCPNCNPEKNRNN